MNSAQLKELIRFLDLCEDIFSELKSRKTHDPFFYMNLQADCRDKIAILEDNLKESSDAS
mgnify:CR=1 FL=1